MPDEASQKKLVPPSSADVLLQADLVQLQQSYEHYRHLENIRLKYIVWLYSFVLALLAFIGTIYTVDPSFVDFDKISLLVLASFTITFFSFFAHLQVNTTEAAISAHDALIARIYKTIYKDMHEELIAKPFSIARIEGKRGSIFLRVFSADSDPTRWLSKVFTAAPAFLSALIGCGLLVSSKKLFDIGEAYTWALYGAAFAAGSVGLISILDALFTRNTQPLFERSQRGIED